MDSMEYKHLEIRQDNGNTLLRAPCFSTRLLWTLNAYYIYLTIGPIILIQYKKINI